MMNLKNIIVCVLLAAMAHAGKVITYTATSQESQEEANNAAIAGVAKQISAQVKVNQELSKEELTIDEKSVLKESYKSKSNVLSDIKIKGISVKPETASKGFKATAFLDLDEFTADIQFKIKTIQLEITKLEETALSYLKEKMFSNAISSIEQAKPLARQHQSLVKELSKIYPVNETHLLKQNIAKIQADIVMALSDVIIKGSPQEMQLVNPETPSLEISVSDKQGPLKNFPLVAKQGRNILLEYTTQENGSASQRFKNVNIEKGPYVIVIEPNLPAEYLEQAGLRKKLEVSFKVTQEKCPVNIQCHEDETICKALEKRLASKSIFLDANAPVLKLDISAKAGNAIEYVPGKFTTPYDISLSLKGENVTFVASGHSNGKQKNDAISAVIKKMDFSSLKKQLHSYCK